MGMGVGCGNRRERKENPNSGGAWIPKRGYHQEDREEKEGPQMRSRKVEPGQKSKNAKERCNIFLAVTFFKEILFASVLLRGLSKGRGEKARDGQVSAEDKDCTRGGEPRQSRNIHNASTILKEQNLLREGKKGNGLPLYKHSNTAKSAAAVPRKNMEIPSEAIPNRTPAPTAPSGKSYLN